jgi:DNA-binding YbaB/EbfC family protein
MKEIQEGLSRLRVHGIAGGGMVTVEANGQQKILSCKIEETLLQTGDQEMLEDLLVSAINQALDKAKETAASEMGKLAGDISIPGLNEALSKFGLGAGPDEQA